MRENTAIITGMSVPAWKRIEPIILSVFCMTAPNPKPRKNVMIQ